MWSADQINLYKSLFRSREDVFAVHWEKSGKSGYMPAYRFDPGNEHRYLHALLGPSGESINYHREGSCCSFKTPNGLFGNAGLLDHYRVTWEGTRDTVDIFINMYDKGNLKIPVGFTAKKRL
jgi:hypothetical protein